MHGGRERASPEPARVEFEFWIINSTLQSPLGLYIVNSIISGQGLTSLIGGTNLQKGAEPRDSSY